jgi:hypothetical protein
MNKLKTLAVAGAVAASSAATAPAFAYNQTLTQFITDDVVTEGIFTIDFVGVTGITDSGFGDTARVDITYIEGLVGDFSDDILVFSLQSMGGYNGATGNTTGSIEYTIELFAGAPGSEADIRFGEVGHSVSVPSGTTQDVGSSKDITGLATVIVPVPGYSDTLVTTPGNTADDTFCGVCRKFNIIDSFDLDFVPGGSIGVMTSIDNQFQTTVPTPATLALMGIGLAGAGLIRRRKKD